MDALFDGFTEIGQLFFGQAPDALLLGLEMHEQDNRKKI